MQCLQIACGAVDSSDSTCERGGFVMLFQTLHHFVI